MVRLKFLLAVLVSLLFACSSPTPETAEEPLEDAQAAYERKIANCIDQKLLEFKHDDGESTAYLNDTPFTGLACTYHKSGKIYTLNTYENGRREGLWEVYYPIGRLHKLGHTRNGEDHGLFEVYFPSGLMQHQLYYENGMKTGVWRSWYVHGGRYTERHFKDDRVHGKVLVWDEQGELAKEYDYEHGRLVKSRMHFEESAD